MIVEWEGRKFIAEMQGKGLDINSLKTYMKGGNYIVSILRPPMSPDAYRVQRHVIRDFDDTLAYDFKGLLGFVFKRVKDEPSRAYCSEYYYQMTREYVPYPNSFAAKVSPRDLQECNLFKPVVWRT
jgi:hypothetical protein